MHAKACQCRSPWLLLPQYSHQPTLFSSTCAATHTARFASSLPSACKTWGRDLTISCKERGTDGLSQVTEKMKLSNNGISMSAISPTPTPPIHDVAWMTMTEGVLLPLVPMQPGLKAVCAQSHPSSLAYVDRARVRRGWCKVFLATSLIVTVNYESPWACQGRWGEKSALSSSY